MGTTGGYRRAMSTTRSLEPAVAIRPIARTDADALERFYEGLSDESRRLRFFAITRGLSHRQSSAFCRLDHVHREGFVATMPAADGRVRVVGHVCLEPIDAASAEVAIAVDDDLQRHGIGRRLIDAAIGWAEERGFERLVATTLTTNAAIYRLLERLDRPLEVRNLDAGTAAVTISLRAQPALAA